MAKQARPTYRIDLRKYRILYFPILLPVALLLALFNKISPVPFKIYLLRVERVGHLSSNQEQLLCELDLGLHPKEFRFFVHRDKPSNLVLYTMLDRVIHFRQWLLPLYDVCQKLGGLGVSDTSLHNIQGRDPLQLIEKTQQHIDFTSEELAEAYRDCEALGVDPEKPFVSVLGRDTAYLELIKEPTDNASYRNVDINTFVPALEYLADTHQVVRLGSIVKDRLNTRHPGIIDYPFTDHKTEMLDVFLSAKCRFFISVGTGLDAIAAYNFRLPVLYVNYIPIQYLTELKGNAICIFKKLWNTKENRYYALSEILNSEMQHYDTPSQLDPLNVAVHDNTEEEILAVTREMNERLNGTWQNNDEDEVLQERFWSKFRDIYGDFPCEARIGTDFLRQNQYLLD